ncbi:MORN repeat-containing protein 5-like [Daktulosphaira vitifoliae]|uniref:MORN repeat-containing protein 5-like n=1 Tax=Daktulosphaira vitifoliae TaxID=58002 RepID=UPI0021AAE78E|nr:MORN repeat-containing protein 5-like [Daktulosphaira vitifoliae]
MNKSINMEYTSNLQPGKPLFSCEQWVALRTGSYYKGEWNEKTMHGLGKYHMPEGAIYVGKFENGFFHGPGTIYYPIGSKIKGIWNKGQCQTRTYIFQDGLKFKLNDWKYCKMTDRRYVLEHKHGLQPAARSRISNREIVIETPKGFYDAGDGFYDPRTNTVHDYETNEMIRVPSDAGAKWIMENCSKGGEVQIPFRPYFNENRLSNTVININDTTAKTMFVDSVIDEFEQTQSEGSLVTDTVSGVLSDCIINNQSLFDTNGSSDDCGLFSKMNISTDAHQQLKYCPKIMNLKKAKNDPSHLQFENISHSDNRNCQQKNQNNEDEPGFW